MSKATRKDLQDVVNAYEQHGVKSAAAAALGLAKTTFKDRYARAKAQGIKPSKNLDKKTGQPEVRDFLKRKARSLEELAELTGFTKGECLDAIEHLRKEGANIHLFGHHYSLEKKPQPAFVDGLSLEYKSEKNNTYTFGVVADTHLGSKYERLDCLEDLYEKFQANGITKVFHAGNYIEGEKPFNRFDIHTHGMDAQLQYLAEYYPRRNGITTYAVSGDDHEGWYNQQVGVDIGKYTSKIMRAL